VKLKRGVRKVTCRECGAEGTIRIGATLSRGRRVKAAEDVPHLESCPYYVREQPRHLKKKQWQKQEKRMNRVLGTRDTLASGAVGKDGDGRAFHKWRMEAKQSADCKYRLTQTVWDKLVSGALLTGEEPVLSVVLNATNYPTTKLVVIRHALWTALDPEGSVYQRSELKNRLSYRLTDTAPKPLLIELDPPGVMLSEAHFLALKDPE
jgi:hypothetical protein